VGQPAIVRLRPACFARYGAAEDIFDVRIAVAPDAGADANGHRDRADPGLDRLVGHGAGASSTSEWCITHIYQEASQ
jgi:hypothetical protein